MRKSQQVFNSQILLSVSALLSIFFNPVIVFIKEIFISHSKNVVTQRKEKADESALIGTAQFVVWDSLLNCFAKIQQIFPKVKQFGNYFT